jgi:hypothetical protein
LSEALSAAAQIPPDATNFIGNNARAEALTGLAPHLPAELLSEALSAATQIRDESARAKALSGLAPHLPAELLSEALSAAAQIRDESARAKALSGLAPHLIKHPELWRPFWAQTYRDLLEAAPYNQTQRLLNRLAPAFPWDLLEDPSQRERAFRKIIAGGKPQGIELTETVAQAVGKLLQDEDNDRAKAILGLLIDPTKETLPKIATWMDNPDPKIRAHAARLLAHRGKLTPDSLLAMIPLLLKGKDIERYRTAKTLHARYGDQRFKVSEIGSETVERLVKLHAEYGQNPRASTILFWTAINILHDDPEAIQTWVASFIETETDQSEASSILGWIHQISEEAWQVLYENLPDGHPLLQATLLNSIYHLLQNGQIPKETTASLKTSLHELATSENEDVRQGAIQCLGQIQQPNLEDIQYLQSILPQEPTDDLWFAVTALADIAVRSGWKGQDQTSLWLLNQAREADDPDRASLLAGGWARLKIKWDKRDLHFYSFESVLDKLADLLDNAPEKILDALWYAGADDIPWHDFHKKVVKTAKGLFAHQHTLAQPLVTKLQNALSDQSKDHWRQRRIALAFAAALAEAAPATFANAADPNQLHRILIQAVEDANSFSARRFALTTLAHLRRVSVEVAAALRTAQRDVAKVQEDALQAVTHFRRVEGNLIPALVEGLYDQSAAAAYATGQLLSALGKSETTTQVQRQAILEALADAIRDPQSKRDVYVMDGYILKYLGTLDQLFHQMLVSIAQGV